MQWGELQVMNVTRQTATYRRQYKAGRCTRLLTRPLLRYAYGTESEIGTGHTAANKLWATGQHSNAVIGCRTLNEALNEAVGCGEDHPFLKKVLLLNGLSLSLAQGLITAARDGCR